MRRAVLNRATRVLGASAIAIAGVALVASPAFAASDSFDNETTGWDSVYDDGMILGDAFTINRDFLSSGVDVEGWNDDAFDGFFYQVRITGPNDSRLIWHADVTPSVFTVVPGGLTESTSTVTVSLYTDAAALNYLYDVTLTMEIQGSYARWTVTVVPNVANEDADALAFVQNLKVGFLGNLGSDDDSEYYAVGADAMVSRDTVSADPVIAYQGVGVSTSFDVTDGDDLVEFNVMTDGTGTAQMVVAVQGGDPCSGEDVLAAQQTRAATLASTFGADLSDLFKVNCLAPAAATTIAAGSVIDQFIPLSDDLDSVDFMNWRYGVGLEEYVASQGDFVAFGSGFPAGLTVELVCDDASS